jgi:tRNA threonylcarbamoyladenosine biosynthesis protein TsaB
MKAEYNIARMVVLALETATRQGSIALVIDQLCHARAGDASRTHGERLPRELLELLDDHQLSLRDVDLLAVVAGPGSFTGLRVGMATIQGLALTAGRRAAPIPTLDAMVEGWRVQQAPGPGGVKPGTLATVVACLDGQRGDIFFAAWTMAVEAPIERATALVEPSVGSIDDLSRLIGERGLDPVAVLIDPTLASRAASLTALGLPVEEVSTPLADPAARMAARRPEQGTAPHALRPLYVRRPDAVLARERAGLLRP